MISLYDYLGKAAGSALGAKVHAYAYIRKAETGSRYVKNPVYEGNIMLYTKEFLDEFFLVQKLFS
jgi:hypothetical protein